MSKALDLEKNQNPVSEESKETDSKERKELGHLKATGNMTENGLHIIQNMTKCIVSSAKSSGKRRLKV